MTASQKHAWFSLSVVVLSALVVLTLLPWLGRGAQGGFGFLGLLGFGPLLFRRGKRSVVVDERDLGIARRSLIVAYTVFWLTFVLACVALPAVYGWGGAVPVVVVQSSVFVALMEVVLITSVATLVQYRLGVVGDAG